MEHQLHPLPVYSKTMSVELILAESRALTASLEGREDAVALIQSVLGMMPPASDVYQETTQAAMRFILGEPIEPPSFRVSDDPLDLRIFEASAKGWILWASQNGSEQAVKDLRSVVMPSDQEGGFLHLMVLRPWKAAVEALLQEEHPKAYRMFRRASELGAQFGTESNPVIQWTCAASFFYSSAIFF